MLTKILAVIGALTVIILFGSVAAVIGFILEEVAFEYKKRQKAREENK